MESGYHLSPQANIIRESLGMGLSKDEMISRLGDIPQPLIKEVTNSLKNDRASLNFEQSVIDDMYKWMKSDKFIFQKNTCSRVHKLIEASKQRKIVNRSGDGNELIDIDEESFSTAQVFVIEHDWAAALGPAINGDDILLPFNFCIFEFMLSGKCLIILAVQEEGQQPRLLGFLKAGGGWYCGNYRDQLDKDNYFLQRAWEQIIAICIALDADVATEEVVRVDTALNKKREKKGKQELRDFHIVELSRRHRVTGPGVGTHRSPRLHFRRGHWRHMEEFKTWIKWTLVGDPDLGFIEKQYKI